MYVWYVMPRVLYEVYNDESEIESESEVIISLILHKCA